jgi:cytochrome c-type biogenesis protein CcmH/NrfF
MTTETDTTSTATETASAEGQVAPETQETPASAPAAEVAATESQPETQPSAAEEEDKAVKAAIDAQFGEAAPEAPESDTVTLSKAELEEREKRAAQSAADSAANQVRQETQRQQELAQARGRIRMDMRRDVEAHVRKAVESGEPAGDIIDEISKRYGLSLFEEANEALTSYMDAEAFQALGAIPGVVDAAPEELTPLSRPFKEPRDKFAAMFEIAVAVTRKQVKAEMADWVEKEVVKRVRPATEAATKRALAEIRGAQPGGELPKGEATGQDPTDADVAKHKGDLAWWNENKEAYWRGQAARKK